MANEKRYMYHAGKPHICRENLDPHCVCKLCGAVCHTLEDDSKGSGTGLVHRWCTRCNAGESFYDDTGTTLSCTLWPDSHDPYKNEWTKADYLRAVKSETE